MGMGERRMRKTKRIKLACLGFTAVMLFILCTQFPYFSDDWVWGSDSRISSFIDGLTNPENPFHYYNNGRYFGNGLGFIGANHFMIRNLIMTAALCLASAMLAGISAIAAEGAFDPPFAVLFTAVLLVFCPPDYFQHTISWNSAFMIYMVPSALYLLSLKKIFGQKADSRTDISFFLLPLLSAFFVENLTIGNLIFIVLLILYRFIRKTKPSVNEWLYLAGSLLGLALMFSDDGYRRIFNGTTAETYWVAETSSLSRMIETGLETYTYYIVSFVFRNNALMTFFGGTGIFLLCLLSGQPSGKNRDLPRCLGLIEFLIGGYFLIKSHEPGWQLLFERTEMMEAVIAAVFLILMPVIFLLLPLSERKKELLIFSWIFAVCITAPLLVASPLSTRVFFPSYTFLLLVYCETAWICFSLIPVISKNASAGWMGITLAGVFLLFWTFWFSIYAVINHYDKARVSYLRYQEEAGAYPILLPKLPYENYMIVSYPDTYIWEERFKRFHRLDLDTKYELISFEEWKALTSGNRQP